MRKSIFAADYVPFRERAVDRLVDLVALVLVVIVLVAIWCGFSWFISLDNKDTVHCSGELVTAELPETTRKDADRISTFRKLAQRQYPDLWYYNYDPVAERLDRDNPDMIVAPLARVQVPQTCVNLS